MSLEELNTADLNVRRAQRRRARGLSLICTEIPTSQLERLDQRAREMGTTRKALMAKAAALYLEELDQVEELVRAARKIRRERKVLMPDSPAYLELLESDH